MARKSKIKGSEFSYAPYLAIVAIVAVIALVFLVVNYMKTSSLETALAGEAVRYNTKLVSPPTSVTPSDDKNIQENLVKSFLISTLEFKGMTEASCADTCKLYNKQCVTAVQTKFTTEWSSKGSVNNANHPCETKSPDFKQNELICLCI